VLGPLEVAVVVRGDVGDEICRLVVADEPVAEAEGGHPSIVGEDRYVADGSDVANRA